MDRVLDRVLQGDAKLKHKAGATDATVQAAKFAACPNEKLANYLSCAIAQKMFERTGLVPKTPEEYSPALLELLELFVHSWQHHALGGPPPAPEPILPSSPLVLRVRDEIMAKKL